MQLNLYFRAVKSSLPHHFYSYLFRNKETLAMQFNLKRLKRKRKHPSRPWIYYVIFFILVKFIFITSVWLLNFKWNQKLMLRNLSLKCIFSLELFYVSANVKRIRNYGLKCNIYLHFSIQHRLIISGEKMLISAEIKRCVA